jgi:hypothetical protein
MVAAMTEAERIRGISDEALPRLGDLAILHLAIARLFEAHGVDDEKLIEDLYRRAIYSTPKK